MEEKNYDENGVHPPSLKEYNNIVPWADVEFPFSNKDGFARYSILGILGYVHLLGLPNTNILEIGVGESSIYLTEIARRLQRKIFYCDIAMGKLYNPMTVKGYIHEDIRLVREFEVIEEDNHKAIAYCGPSDSFFTNIKCMNNIGIAFIDGDHKYEQVKKDFINTLELLVPHGVIFLHDTFPNKEELVLGEYCADAYKVRKEIELDSRLDCFTFTKTVGVDVGITMVRKKLVNGVYYNE